MARLFLLILVLFAAAARGADPASAPAAPAAAPTPSAAEAGKDPEALLAAEVTRHLVEGRAVELAVGERKVLALQTEQTAGPKGQGALLLLHDLGGHADWPGVVAGTRRALPALGWTTLSLQLPLPPNGRLDLQRTTFLDQSTSRIETALAHLRANHDKVVIVGHGMGAVAALDFAVNRPESVQGLILVGLPHLVSAPGAPVDPRLDTAAALARVRIPVLDLYGSGDRRDVVATAAARRTAAKTGADYDQTAISGADHFFRGQEQPLARRVRGWLERLEKKGALTAVPQQPTTTTPQAQP